jgi:hypothetical protein
MMGEFFLRKHQRFQLFHLFKNLLLYLPVTEATNKLARSFMVDFTDYMRPVDIIWGYVYLKVLLTNINYLVISFIQFLFGNRDIMYTKM